MISRNLKIPRRSVSGLLVGGMECLLFSACAFKNKESAPPTTAESVVEKLQKEKSREAADGVLTKDNVSIEFVENPTPNSYQMVLRWPPTIRNMTFQINDGPIQIKNNTDVAEFTVKGDQDQNVHMIAYGTVSAAPLSSADVSAYSPTDVVVNTDVVMKEDRIVIANRLFLQPRGQFITNGFNLTINVNKLKIEGDARAKLGIVPFTNLAKILTFVPDTLASSERELKGSVITINAREAKGDFPIALVGVNGRKGLPGSEVEKTKKDVPSRTPAAPLKEKHGVDGTQSQAKLRGSNGRNGVDGAMESVEAYCTKEPGSGLKGVVGAPGIQGGKGEQGGNCGVLILNIEDSKELRVEVRQKAGAPGEGGDGGPGFPGGLGGTAGKKPEACTAVVTDGEQGDTGSKGPQGEKGEPGKSANIPAGSTPVSILEL